MPPASPSSRSRSAITNSRPPRSGFLPGAKVKLVVDNQDAGPEEFDSHALNREKVIPGKTKATIFIGPLAPGRYPFIGEFNATTARGEVVAQ